MEPASLAHQGGFGCGGGRGGGSTVWAGLGGIYCVWGSFGGHLLCGATLGASTVWVNSDQLNPMCFKQASLKQEKEGKSGPQTP